MADESRVCPACGHPAFRHRESLTTAATKPGDPVPCWQGGCGCTRQARPVEVKS